MIDINVAANVAEFAGGNAGRKGLLEHDKGFLYSDDHQSHRALTT